MKTSLGLSVLLNN